MSSRDVSFGCQRLINVNDGDEVAATFCAFLEQIYEEVLERRAGQRLASIPQSKHTSQRAPGLYYTAPHYDT